MLPATLVERAGPAGTAHVVVLGNEKGGSGKTTLAMHLIVALLQSGYRVGSIDIDSRQQSLTRYIENRGQWAARGGIELEVPEHYTVVLGPDGHLRKDEEAEFAAFADAVTRIEHYCDFLIIDAPGSDNYLSRLGHSMADTLITPINDSFVDLDVLANVDGETYEIRQISRYAEMVAGSRRRRDAVDSGRIDWVAVRNRVSPLTSRNARHIDRALRGLTQQLDIRVAPGLAERVVYRELFPRGLTLFDIIQPGSDEEFTASHLAAQMEIRSLLDAIGLPVRQAGTQRPADAPPLAGNQS